MELFIKGIGLLLSLSILVFFHELGHFLFAKLFKIKVEKFYLFFDYKFSLIKFTKWGTEFGIGWIPFGGYCKIAGMIDESMDTEQMKQEPQDWEYRSKPAWQRLLVITGGVLFNMILAFMIYTMLIWKNGDTSLPIENMTYGMVYNSTLKSIGFQDGDKIITIDGVKVKNRGDLIEKLIFEDSKKVTIERNDSLIVINLPNELDQIILKSGAKSLVRQFIPTIVSEVSDNMGAKKAGILKGDKFLAINNTEASDIGLFLTEIKNYTATTINFTILRGNDTLTVPIEVNSNHQLGFAFTRATELFTYITKEYTFLESIPAGIIRAKNVLVNYAKQMKILFTKEGVKQMGGFGAIASMFPPSWDWDAFWGTTAFISIILAFMNILPIPALDGGYVLLILYELITRRKPSEKFLEKAITAGFIFLIILVLYANLNDIYKLF